MRDAGKLFIEQMDAAELSPGEFSHRVRDCVDREECPDRRDRQPEWLSDRDARGAVPDLHLHELLQYLNRRALRPS